MTELNEVFQECLQLAEDVPKFPQTMRSVDRSDPTPPEPPEVRQLLESLATERSKEVDSLAERLILDRHTVEADPVLWILLEHRIRAAVYHFDLLAKTLPAEATLHLDMDTDYAVLWALTGLWNLAGPLWLNRAAILIAAGKELSYTGSTKDLI